MAGPMNPSHLKVKRLVELDAIPAGAPTDRTWLYAVHDNKDYKTSVADLAEDVSVDAAELVKDELGQDTGANLVGYDGVTAGEALDYALSPPAAVDVATQTYPQSVGTIRTSGYAVEGDGGEAAYTPQQIDVSAQPIVAGASPSTAALVDKYVRIMKNVGLWDKARAVFFLSAPEEVVASRNWKNPAETLTSVAGSVTFSPGVGYTGNGTAYLETGINLSTSGGAYAVDSASMAVGVFSGISEGAGDMGTNTALIRTSTSDNGRPYIRTNTSGTTPVVGTQPAVGLTAWSQLPSQALVYKNGREIQSLAITSTPMTNTTVRLLHDGVTTAKSTKGIDFAFIGAALTASDHLLLNSLREEWNKDVSSILTNKGVVQDNDGRVWSISGDVYNVKAFGAGTGNAARDTEAFRSAVLLASARNVPFTILIPSGTYYLNDEIPLTFARTRYKIEGSGPSSTNLIVSGFGCGKKLWKLDHNLYSPNRHSTVHSSISGFTMRNTSSAVNAGQPIGIYYPDANRFTIENVSFGDTVGRGWSNTAIFMPGVFNSQIENCKIGNAGLCRLEKEVPANATFSITSGDTEVVSSHDTFSVEDVGREFFVWGAGRADSTGPAARVMVATIASYNSPTSVELDTAATSTATASVASFGPVKGSITATQTTLTVSGPVLTAQDVGRYIHVDKAAEDSGALSARIVSVTSPTECVLDVAAVSTVSNAVVHFGPVIFMGRYTPDFSVGANRAIVSDVRLDRVTIEQARGIGIMVAQGNQVTITGYKYHGRALSSNNNSATSSGALYVDRVKAVNVEDGLWSWGNYSPDSGMVVVTGEPYSTVILEGISCLSPLNGAYFIENRCDPNTDPMTHVIVGNLSFDDDITSPGLVAGYSTRVYLGGIVACGSTVVTV